MKKIKRLLKLFLLIAIIAIISIAEPASVSAEEPAVLSDNASAIVYITSSGWYDIGGGWRYFHSAGDMAADEWLLCDGSWHYLKPNGMMAAGEILSIDGKTYAFDYRGACVIDTDEKIWWFFKSKDMSDYAAAGIIGNLYAESLLNPENLQNSCEKRLGFSDKTYTMAVDDETYTRFAGDSAGYGLAQWTIPSRKLGLLKLARSSGASIGDIDVQLAFIWEELNGTHSGVLSALEKVKSVREASDIFMMRYECPADQGAAAKSQRASYGKVYYDKFTASSSTHTVG